MKHFLPSSHFLLLCIGLLQSVAGLAQLHGDYTIDPSGSGSTNFASFNAAVSALENQGVDSAVIFYVKEGTYNEQLTIDSIPGTSESNAVLFTADTTNSSETRIEYGSNCNSNWVVNISGGDYLTFDQLVIHNTGIYPCHQVFLLEDHSQHVTIQNSEVSTALANGNSNQSALISSLGSSVSDFTVSNNTLYGAAFGLRLNGTSTNLRISDLVVEGNTLLDQYHTPFSAINCEEVKVIGNTISADSALFATSRAILMEYCEDIDIIGNTIHAEANMGYQYGVLLSNCIGNSGAEYHRVANNCIQTGNASSTAVRGGIYMYNSGIFDLVHNAVNVQTSYQNNNGIHIYSGGLLNLYNNVVRVPSGGALQVFGQYSLTSCDYNAFYSGGGNPFYFNASISSLEDWQSNTGFDLNSHWTDAAFQNNTPCATCNELLDNSGSPIAGMTLDIDGRTRSSIQPDIGAIEFVAASSFSLGPDSTHCADSLVLEAGGASSVSWLVNGNQANTPSVTLLPNCEPETYTVTANVQTAYCGSGSDIAVVTVVPSPNLPSDAHLCVGESVTLESCGGNSATYSWLNNSSSGKTITINEAGMYSVVKTELGCDAGDTVWVTQSDSIKIEDIEMCEKDLPVSVDATIIDGVFYGWSNSLDSTAISVFLDEGTYSVTATDVFGCADSQTFEIVALDEPTAVINETHSGLTFFFDASGSLEITENSTFLWECASASSIHSPDSISTVMVFPWINPNDLFEATVKLTVDNGCGQDTKTIIITREGWPPHPGIEDVSTSLFTVFPNPMKNLTTFRCEQCSGAYTFRLMDASGRLCSEPRTLQRNQFDFQRGELPSGIYFYELESKDFLERGKLVIQ